MPKDDTLAVEWYRRAAVQGLAVAQTNLGVRYASGSGVGRSQEEAASWFRKAAEQGDATAQFNIGVMYANGTGVRQDVVEAFRWLSLAASQSSGSEQQRYAAARDALAAHMTAAQIAEARSRATRSAPPAR